MGKKKLSSDGILFCGESSNGVTGSQYYVKFGKYQILLECGLYQSAKDDYLEGYKANAAKFAFKPKELDYVFVCHAHIDHCGLLPRLVREGFNGKIICTSSTAMIMKPLLTNSCGIIKNEAKLLSKKYSREYKPLYEDEDVEGVFRLIETYDKYDTTIRLNDEISFQWLRNSHCVGAAQLRLILSEGTKFKRILYSSDIGALQSCNHYMDDTEYPVDFNDVVIMESTYGGKREKPRKRSRDIEMMKAAVDTTIERNGTVIFPCFSFSRTQEILSTLSDIYNGDESFRAEVYIDSLLSCEITEMYNKTIRLYGDREYWRKVLEWNRVHLIKDKADSRNVIADDTPKIIITSSGFCRNGRIVEYLKRYLKDERAMIIFSGFVGDNPSYLSYRIKNFRSNRYIRINGENVPNKADCVSLTSFSSHAGLEDLLEYGENLNTNKVVLVHGDEEAKANLAAQLKERISKMNKTYRVCVSVKGMKINL